METSQEGDTSKKSSTKIETTAQLCDDVEKDPAEQASMMQPSVKIASACPSNPIKKMKKKMVRTFLSVDSYLELSILILNTV